MKKLLLFLILFSLTPIYSQYCGNATTNVTITPSTTIQYTSTYTSGRRAFNFNAIAGNEYTFSTVGETSMDTYLRLYSTGTGGSLLASNDDYGSTQSEITWTCPTSGTYSILLTRWSASNNCANLNSTGARIRYQMGDYQGSTVVTIGTGTSLTYEVPVSHYYEYGWSGMIYTQSEINTEGEIQKIRFQTDPDSPSSYIAENQKIYMAHTTLSTFPNSSVKENAQSNYSLSNYMLVYSGTITWIPGWVEITLDVPFPWNNTNNLLIKYENRENSWSFYYPMFYYTPKTNSVGFYYQDNSYPTVDGYRDAIRPNLKLVIGESSALPVELTLFEGINKGANNVLFWSTATEHNSNYFNVQKSRDGETWNTIVTINAAGNSSTHIDYSIVDSKIDPIFNYYRLQQYDFDGAYETYGPIAINNMDMGIKTIVKLLNLTGQEIDWEQATAAGVYIEVYSDGTSKKVYR